MKTTRRKDVGQNGLKETNVGRPPQSKKDDAAPKDGDSRTPVKRHHAQPVVKEHPEGKEELQDDEKIGMIVVTFFENKKKSPCHRRGGLAYAPLALPPRLPCIPAGQIVANKLARRPHTTSYIGYDDDEQQDGERSFKRIRTRKHNDTEPALHMVSP